MSYFFVNKEVLTLTLYIESSRIKLLVMVIREECRPLPKPFLSFSPTSITMARNKDGDLPPPPPPVALPTAQRAGSSSDSKMSLPYNPS